MLDTDIEGLGPKEAAAYVLSFLTTLKQTELALAKNGEQLALWTRRVTLARDRGEATLAEQAQARVTELETRRSGLETELAELRAKVGVLKEKLVRLRITAAKGVDVDVLLAQLEMLAGKKDTLAEAMKQEEAKAKLDELKRKMNEGGRGAP